MMTVFDNNQLSFVRLNNITFLNLMTLFLFPGQSSESPQPERGNRAGDDERAQYREHTPGFPRRGGPENEAAPPSRVQRNRQRQPR